MDKIGINPYIVLPVYFTFESKPDRHLTFDIKFIATLPDLCHNEHRKHKEDTHWNKLQDVDEMKLLDGSEWTISVH